MHRLKDTAVGQYLFRLRNNKYIYSVVKVDDDSCCSRLTRSYRLYSSISSSSSSSSSSPDSLNNSRRREGLGKPKGYSDSSIRYVLKKEMKSGLPYAMNSSQVDHHPCFENENDRSKHIQQPYIVLGKLLILE
jgi:hypothetical protein